MAEVTLDMDLLRKYIRLLGDSVILFTPFFETNPGAGEAVQDYGPKGHHLLNTTAFDYPPIIRGSLLAYRFNGTDEAMTLADHNDFSFGADGTAPNEPTFSVGMWVNMVDSTSSVLMAKWDLTGAAEDREWAFELESNDYPRLTLFDESADKHIGREDQTALSERTWHFLVATKGSGVTCADVKIYVDGVQTDDADVTAATYVAMENGGTQLTLGSYEGAGGAQGNFFDGMMWGPFVVDSVLTVTEILDLYRTGRRLLEV